MNEEKNNRSDEEIVTAEEEKKSTFKRVRRGLGRAFGFIMQRPLLQSLFLSLCLFSLVDMLHYRSIFGSLVHFVTYPHFFLLNVLIVWFTLLPALFLRRRLAYYLTVSLLWFGFSVANCVMLTPGIRTTPLEANDLEMLFTDPLSIVNMVLETGYLPLFMVILIAAVILLAIAGIVFLWFKLPLRRRAFWPGLIAFASSALVLTIVIVSFRAAGVLPSRFKNLKQAYSTYGFSYCLPCTFIDRGIDKPEEYEKKGQEKVASILQSYEHLTTAENAEKPNIIFLQLESFFNVNDLASYAFNQDPTPFFNGLKNSCPHGYLSVPSIAAGTANTEFEVITGMSLDFFGAAEYPYKTVLQKTVCESTAYALKGLGYEASAIHNHTGTFYDRHEVYARMGFDRFISSEFMAGSDDRNLTGWVRDAVLTEEIMSTLTATEKTDYIYTVSVQGHGGYPSSGDIDDFGIKAVAIADKDEAEIMQYNYYVNQMRDMDNFLRELTDALSAFEEKTVLVMYGDHLPGLNIEEEDFKKDRAGLYETEYVVWSNYDLQNAPTERKNVRSYQLSAYVLDLLGIHEGNVLRHHQANSSNYDSLENSEKYSDGLWMLQYDLLYGERYAYGGKNALQPTDMTFGLHPTVIHKAEALGGGFSLYGENFTPDTRILLNGEELERVVYFGPDQIVAAFEEDQSLKKGDKITAFYRGQNADILSKVEYIVP